MSARSRDDLLADLRDLCDEIAANVAAWDRGDFLTDRNKQRVFEREMELLGEVATRLGDEVPPADIDWKHLRDLRILLAHVYHKVDPALLWTFATVDVPRIREAL